MGDLDSDRVIEDAVDLFQRKTFGLDGHHVSTVKCERMNRVRIFTSGQKSASRSTLMEGRIMKSR